MKKICKKIATIIYTTAFITMVKLTPVFADVTFNESQAKADIKAITDPVSNFLLFIALPITAISIGISYVGWNGKDEQEKENMPFHKVVMKHVIAFIFFGLSGAILKWFSIS